MKYIDGDLIRFCRAGKFDVMVHGCNCWCQMGSGIAKQVRAECPEAYMTDQMTNAGDMAKLGTLTYATIEPKQGRDAEFICVNLYSQYNYGKDGKQYLDYKALERGLIRLKGLFSDKRIGLPLIGAGLAGGDWKVIEKIIERILGDCDVTIVIKK